MKKVTNREFIWYLGCGLLVVLGLIAVIFGIIGYHISGPAEQNFIQKFEDSIHFELRFLGLIFIGAGVALSIAVLVFNAKKADREVEKKIRREQRIAAQASKTIEVKNAVEIVEEAPKKEEPVEAK